MSVPSTKNWIVTSLVIKYLKVFFNFPICLLITNLLMFLRRCCLRANIEICCPSLGWLVYPHLKLAEECWHSMESSRGKISEFVIWLYGYTTCQFCSQLVSCLFHFGIYTDFVIMPHSHIYKCELAFFLIRLIHSMKSIIFNTKAFLYFSLKHKILNC